MNSMRTDLAMESLGGASSFPGVEVRQWETGGVELTEVIVQNEDAAKKLGKPCGNYLTLECRLLAEQDLDARIAVTNLHSSVR